MKRTLTLLFTLLALGTFALAQTLPTNANVTVTNDHGSTVGRGTIDNGTLNLSLQTGEDGFVKITISTPSGSQTIDAMVRSNGSVTVVNNNQFVSLPDFAKSGGLSGVTVTPTPPSASGSSNDGSGTSGSGSTGSVDNSPDGSGSQAGDSGSSQDQAGSDASGSQDSSPDHGTTGGSASEDQHSGTQAGSTGSSQDSSPDSNESAGSGGDDSVSVGTNVGGSQSGSGSTSGSTSGSSGSQDGSGSHDD